MAGKYFDEWMVGEEYHTPSRTLTETDVVMFAAMSGDYNELHTSEEFMKNAQLRSGLFMAYLGWQFPMSCCFEWDSWKGPQLLFCK